MKITVYYWRGTLQLTGIATTYRGARRIASRNQNKFGPTYYDEQGNQLYDVGFGLAYPEVDEEGRIFCAV